MLLLKNEFNSREHCTPECLAAVCSDQVSLISQHQMHRDFTQVLSAGSISGQELLQKALNKNKTFNSLCNSNGQVKDKALANGEKGREQKTHPSSSHLVVKCQAAMHSQQSSLIR